MGRRRRKRPVPRSAAELEGEALAGLEAYLYFREHADDPEAERAASAGSDALEAYVRARERECRQDERRLWELMMKPRDAAWNRNMTELLRSIGARLQGPPQTGNKD